MRMSEKEPQQFETGNDNLGETIPVNRLDKKEQITPYEEKEMRQQNIESARADIEEIAESSKDKAVAQDIAKDSKDNEIKWTSKELISQTYDRTLSSIRNRLKKPEKTFSRVIHQPVIEKGSEAIGVTIARPSGILFGGVFSFIGSLLGYLLAKRLGGELPYSIFALFFVGGFVFGIFIEFAWYFYRKRKQRIN